MERVFFLLASLEASSSSLCSFLPLTASLSAPSFPIFSSSVDFPRSILSCVTWPFVHNILTLAGPTRRISFSILCQRSMLTLNFGFRFPVFPDINASRHESVTPKQRANTLRALRADIQHARRRFVSRVAHRGAIRADIQHARSVLLADSHITARFARTFGTPAA